MVPPGQALRVNRALALWSHRVKRLSRFFYMKRLDTRDSLRTGELPCIRLTTCPTGCQSDAGNSPATWYAFEAESAALNVKLNALSMEHHTGINPGFPGTSLTTLTAWPCIPFSSLDDVTIWFSHLTESLRAVQLHVCNLVKLIQSMSCHCYMLFCWWCSATMPPMGSLKVVIATVVGGTGLALASHWEEKRSVNASWTTHYNTPEPVYKWDNNWDK